MSSATEAFDELLRASGQSITGARRKVFSAFIDQEPLTMQELISRVGKVDRASAYRAVELFERLGIVQRLHTGWKYKLELTDKFATHHHHLTCVRCGRSTTISEAELELVIERLAHTHGFTPQSHQIEIQGVCSDCLRLSQERS